MVCHFNIGRTILNTATYINKKILQTHKPLIKMNTFLTLPPPSY